MAEQLEAKRESAERRLYKRLVISYHDLAEARNYLFRLLGEDGTVAPDPADKVLRSALQTAFIVAYARPFSGNKAAEDVLPDIPGQFVRQLTPEQRALHSEVIRRRNEEFAHSDPSAADVSIYVSDIDTTPRYATPVSSVTRAPLSGEELRTVDALCERLYAYVFDKMQELATNFRLGERF